MQFCGYNCATSTAGGRAGAANVFTFRVKNMPNSIPVLDASGNQDQGRQQAAVSMPLVSTAAPSPSFAIQFSLLRPSLTCAINSVNISRGSAPRRREEKQQHNRHTHTQGTTPCGHDHYDIFTASFSVNLQFNVHTGYLEILLLAQLFSRCLFLLPSCLASNLIVVLSIFFFV